VTRRLTTKFAEEWRKNHPDGDVTQRDLSATALPLITDDWDCDPTRRFEADAGAAGVSFDLDELIEELAGGGHGRHWRADVQLLDPFVT